MHDKDIQFRRDDDDLEVVLGAHNIHKKEKQQIKRDVTFSIIHSTWNVTETKFTGDIAALRLSKPVKYNMFIHPVCLAGKLEKKDENTFQNVSKGVLYGWGKNEEGADQSVPLKVELPIKDLYHCLKKNSYIPHLVWSKSFCAGVKGSGACEGDSGSGIVAEINGRYSTLR